VHVDGIDPRRARAIVGYVAQQRVFDRDLPLRGTDLVRLGLDGHRWGISLRRSDGQRVADAIEAVDAARFADSQIGRLSGGEQQRLRIAQVLVRRPELIVADEPLLSLDLAQQQNVVELLAEQRRSLGTAVVFITHDINPVLPHVDRVLYLTGESAATGSVDEVMTSDTLSRLYRSPVDVLHVRGRLIVVGTPESDGHHH
jgi:zinc/manganese transport system ATP-binding protein